MLYLVYFIAVIIFAAMAFAVFWVPYKDSKGKYLVKK